MKGSSADSYIRRSDRTIPLRLASPTNEPTLVGRIWNHDIALRADDLGGRLHLPSLERLAGVAESESSSN